MTHFQLIVTKVCFAFSVGSSPRLLACGSFPPLLACGAGRRRGKRPPSPRAGSHDGSEKELFACLKELRNSVAAKMSLLICVMGDEAAPFHHGVTENITPKQGGKQFVAFE